MVGDRLAGSASVRDGGVAAVQRFSSEMDDGDGLTASVFEDA
jgi:hypothetical protein